MKLAINLFLCFLVAFCSTIKAQEISSQSPKRIYTTTNIGENTPPVIDGKLDDAVWDTVEWSKEFIELSPDENTPPSQRTRFKILYDDRFLYVGIRAYDTAVDSIAKRLGRRDGFDGDWVEINIDSDRDLRTCFSFTSSATGVKGDEFASLNGKNWDKSWSPIWTNKSQIDEEGWSTEMKIPLSQLRFSSDDEQVWGIQVQRFFFRKQERSLWQRKPVTAPGWISEFGELHGLKGLKPQKQLEIQPFTVTKLDTYPEEVGNPYRDGNDFNINAGLDAKIGITNDLTLDLTVNPDFGQVEADPAAITLDGFEIFFEEQRPFFVQNKNIFDYNFGNNQDNLFFSRRIGRNPQGYPNAPSGAYVDLPDNTTILGAAKFSGKTKNGWSIGVLESVTANQYAEIDLNGSKSKELVEPLTNYFVGRLQKDFNNRNSYVGGIFTATNRNLEDHLNYLRKEAYTGGFDFKHQWQSRRYFVEGNIVSSHVKGSKEAITETQTSLTHLFNRVDASHVTVDTNRTSLTGTGGRLSAGKVGGGHWEYNGGVIWRSPELELNDVGFLRQADEIRQYFNLSFRTLKPTESFRRISARFQQFTTYDFEGNFNRIQYSLGGNFLFKNNNAININTVHKPRIYINSALRGGPRWRYSQEDHVSVFFNTDESKKFKTSFGFAYSGAKQNNFSMFSTEIDLTYQPTNALTISLNPSYNNNPSKTQYVTQTDYNGTTRYVLGTIDNKTLSASIRLNYTINPNLTIQYYGQPFISRARFSSFKYVTNPTADDLYDRFDVYDSNQITYNNGVYEIDEDIDSTTDYSFGDPDFSFVQFRSNLVMRWEYIPGSELYFVWAQGITGLVDPSERLTNGLEQGILNQKPQNTFLIKATYRFVL